MSQPQDDAPIGVTAFKARCLSLIDAVAEGRRPRVLLTRHNRVVAALVPVEQAPPPALWGALRGTVTLAPGADLTEGTGETWDANG